MSNAQPDQNDRLRKRRANADYTVVDREPLRLKTGETVELGVEDKAWTGWIWITAASGRGTWVPAQELERLADGREARVLGDFEAVDLSVTKGETVECLREVSGWFWCRNAAGGEGWLPDYVLGD